ncbi:motile sperm domain-containing protein 1-like isoform X1 [Vespa mandarinia]|nr:motile sperm domain-containing protein 1-like isoform X1 [Vespa mandarinia]XP_035732426.1 motile sperm domain-containing protein 1-like isoform X1 [Vespa mandarinia]XP_035732434.1 motile sperm domain-containing protein 1-like isoform X1 [Vespa mandarinia]XP_035732443.1 motile sperm domain-containing protein 1-like isoform X1 [Vespa mandarinia]XP_035732452.1 motile sperm domain-containing protein 1-like isoform X1 [Vespa mandarinia]XP_043674329.1 motile sperm domain-containing protein 1-like
MQSQLAATPRKLPVFVFPSSITFYLENQSTHKQVLTLYNPYDFPVKFKVLCTAPNKYKVVDPEGTIKAKCCVDIVVRHTALLISNCNVTDKFRIQMQEHPSKQATGKRDVEATLLPGTSETAGRATPDPEMFQQLPINETRQQQSYALITQNRTIDNTSLKIHKNLLQLQYDLFHGEIQDKITNMFLSSNMKNANCIIVDKGGTNYVALIAGIICIAGLLLPTEGERSHTVPDYLHLSINFKLIFSFVLGMVTIIILRL